MYLSYANRLIKRALPLVLVAALLGAAAGWFGATATRQYTTTSYLAMAPETTEEGVRAVEPERFFQTQSQVLLSDPVMKDAATKLGDGTSPEMVRKSIKLGGGATNDVLELAVAGDSADESRNRNAAVVEALKSAKFKDVSFAMLWTSEPKASVDPKKMLIAGLLAGAALGAILALLWGAIRRPLLDPRAAQFSDERLAVYPRVVGARASAAEARSWLETRNDDQLPVVAVAVDDSPTTQQTIESLGLPEAASRAEGPRFMVYVTSARSTTEAAVDTVVSSTAGPKDELALLIASPKPASPERTAL